MTMLATNKAFNILCLLFGVFFFVLVSIYELIKYFIFNTKNVTGYCAVLFKRLKHWVLGMGPFVFGLLFYLVPCAETYICVNSSETFKELMNKLSILRANNELLYYQEKPNQLYCIFHSKDGNHFESLPYYIDKSYIVLTYVPSSELFFLNHQKTFSHSQDNIGYHILTKQDKNSMNEKVSIYTNPSHNKIFQNTIFYQKGVTESKAFKHEFGQILRKEPIQNEELLHQQKKQRGVNLEGSISERRKSHELEETITHQSMLGSEEQISAARRMDLESISFNDYSPLRSQKKHSKRCKAPIPFELSRSDSLDLPLDKNNNIRYIYSPINEERVE
ncbi:hypothetical protein ENUP19_0339G0012 [Entamoeba nuttalli]|uniref:Transmembrane protein n=2 Tax=Entamoeba nuttalli TaxID=412467 RepID=K2GJ57_ENTNP|nr:hypothetical protein ENU1_011010 [Entamoeba nuttalli P19]EKE42766.1 hypothetical protein ENU1_011010 [Entamoeba nuttalli P19]|eukprot:XP_008854899.1 hypothetical protein ENU1_011010 [Entamoeba nuttalli P19]